MKHYMGPFTFIYKPEQHVIEVVDENEKPIMLFTLDQAEGLYTYLRECVKKEVENGRFMGW